MVRGWISTLAPLGTSAHSPSGRVDRTGAFIRRRWPDEGIQGARHYRPAVTHDRPCIAFGMG